MKTPISQRRAKNNARAYNSYFQANQQDYKMEEKYITIHSLEALKAKQFSIILANIDNTPEKLKLAEETYPLEFYYIEKHKTKYNLSVKF